MAGDARAKRQDTSIQRQVALFLDFSHGGVVRTAPFVLTVER